MSGLFKKKKPPVRVSAVIAAAGTASRMGGIDKQMLMLGDMPVVARSIAQFSECPRVFEIIVVCRREDIASFLHMSREFGFDKVSSVVAGGEHRQDSVFAGIDACAKGADYYAIHDGARPFATPELIGECIEAAIRYGCAAAGVPVKDTIKVAGQDGFIESTPDRAGLFSIQTPQVFRADTYRRAMEQARLDRRYYTDDCQLIEQTGGKVFISRGSYDNMKITTPEDIAAAHAVFAVREGML